ncbi:MAG: ribonuclease T [Erythrobacter sp.]|uniref:ribonuclease T2 family protein n=1 Tax=Erythrobacter sp. TaxID=1042 RepID=UPI002621D632|nr:ribonuclease T [Erythrobacter sp.]MDJ0978543.1 ribonuclease T [Erythrobacter sp.]
MRPRRFAWTLALLALPATAHAQAYQCRAPRVSSVPQIAADSKPRRVPITGYTLALSWSPEFCKPRESAPAHRVQCSGENGRFGLVVHGLWPQGTRTWPQWCRQENPLTPAELRKRLCMMPSARLIARQWAKHGSCMTKRPETYFGVTQILWESLRIPEYDRISREEGLTAGRIRRAFAEANPGLPASAVGVKLNERGWLQELRLCYSKRFRPTRCDDRRYGARDGARARIWRGL